MCGWSLLLATELRGLCLENMDRRTFGLSGGFGGGGTSWVCGLRGVLLARCSAGAGDTAFWVGLAGIERRPGMG